LYVLVLFAKLDEMVEKKMEGLSIGSKIEGSDEHMMTLFQSQGFQPQQQQPQKDRKSFGGGGMIIYTLWLMVN
jgi:hypothetical protein